MHLHDRLAIAFDGEALGRFCHKWKIAELAVFGSALRPRDFKADSDIDFLVTFALPNEWSLFDHMRMEEELAAIVGRPVDLVTRRSVERSHNWIRRRSILESALSIYVA